MKKLRDTDNTVVIARGREWMKVEEDKGKISGDRRDLLVLGRWTHNAEYRWCLYLKPAKFY